MRLLLAPWLGLLALAVSAQVPIDYARDLPPVPPREPSEALATFRVEPGFRLELVAAEPLIADPVELAFDERGRLWVLEFPQYNQEFPGGNPRVRGRLRVLTDRDGDGIMDTAATFAEGLNYASAFALWRGGVFLGETPDIVYLSDTDGDGRADRREVVFTGFAKEARRAGHAQLNSFRWGPDHRIHVCTNTGGVVSRPGSDDQSPVDVRGRGFSFDPQTLRYEVRSGGGQHGLTFDAWGNQFTCHSSTPAMFVVYDARYLSRNPWLRAPSPAIRIHPPLAEYPLYDLSPDEPWRVLRSRLRTAGAFMGQADTRGGVVVNQGFFTAATGLTVYTGDAFPAEYQGSTYIGEPASNLVHRARLRRDGVSFVSEPTNAASKSEFLASTDNWFRPVQFANGPDGALYVADLYRELIEGGTFLPDEMLRHLGVVNGQDRGRIYRVLPVDRPTRKLPDLSGRTEAELVSLLAHPNGWHRETASRLIYERHSPAAVQPLRHLASAAPSALTRTHARRSLSALGAYSSSLALAALDESDADALVHSLRLAEPFAPTSNAIRTRLARLTAHASPPVRFQALFSLSTVRHAEMGAVIAQSLRQDGADRWFRLAALTAVKDHVADVFSRLLPSANDRAAMEILRELAVMAAASGDPGELAAVCRALATGSGSEPARRRALLEAMLTQGGPAGRQALRASPDEDLRREVDLILRQARTLAFDPAQPAAVRASRLPMLDLLPFAELRAPLLQLLTPGQNRALQPPALALLARFPDAEIGPLIIAAWTGLSPSLRGRAADVLLSRPAWALACLEALHSGRLSRSELGSVRIGALRQHADPAVRERARQVLGAAGLEARAEVLTRYRPALDVPGDARAGEVVFNRTCAACHVRASGALPVGPVLTGVGQLGREPLLLSILDPNRDVRPEYAAYSLRTREGTTHTGVLQQESANSLTLRRLDGTEIDVLRVELASLTALGFSFMPEGLEEQISLAEMSDLLAYLETLR